MKKRRYEIIVVVAALSLAMSGCGTIGGPAADLGLAGAGGVAGYHVSDGKISAAAAGAAVGYLGSRIAQAEVKKTVSEAEQRGYDRALNQAVKQQYWIMQNRQRETAAETEARLVPVVIPETNLNGVIQKAHIEYLRVQ